MGIKKLFWFYFEINYIFRNKIYQILNFVSEIKNMKIIKVAILVKMEKKMNNLKKKKNFCLFFTIPFVF